MQTAIQTTVDLLGGFEATGRVCGVSGKAVMGWVRRGRLPRTEWTGETDYARRIVASLGAGARVTRADLVPASAGRGARCGGR